MLSKCTNFLTCVMPLYVRYTYATCAQDTKVGNTKFPRLFTLKTNCLLRSFFLRLFFVGHCFPNKKFALENKAVIFVPKRLCLFSLQPAQRRNSCEGNKISPPYKFLVYRKLFRASLRTRIYIYIRKVLYLISKLQVYM